MHKKGKWCLRNETGMCNEQKSKTPALFSARVENAMDCILCKLKEELKDDQMGMVFEY